MALLLAATALGAGPAAAAEVRLDPTRQFQTISGWEVTSSGLEVKTDGSYDPWWRQNGGLVLDVLVGDLGINRVRLELRSGVENPVDYFAAFVSGQIGYDQMEAHFYDKVNDNADPSVASAQGFQFTGLDFDVETEVLPIKQRLEAKGEKLFLSLCYVDFNSPIQGSLSHALNEAEYSELILAAFDHLRSKYGLRPDALELILEPDNSRSWRGAQIGRALVSVQARLHAAGHDPEFIAPSTAAAGLAVPYFTDLVAVPRAAGLAKTLSYHRYGLGDLSQIWATARANGMKTAMLEHVSGNADELVEDLTIANVSAWQKYAVAQISPSQDYAYLSVDRTVPSSPIISLNSRAAPLLPYFKSVRRGAVRIDAQSDDPAAQPVAFVNADGGYAVIAKSPAATTLRVIGLPAGTYKSISVRLDSVTAETGPDVTIASGAALSLNVPAGVTAVFARPPAAMPAPVPRGSWLGLLGLALLAVGASSGATPTPAKLALGRALSRATLWRARGRPPSARARARSAGRAR